MKKQLLTVIFAIIALGGCAAQKTLTPTGGSRSDGIVKLSYEYGQYEIPQVDKDSGVAVAKQRCAAWGYTGAEAFGGQTKQCNNTSMGSCVQWMVTVEYQCTGTPPTPRS